MSSRAIVAKQKQHQIQSRRRVIWLTIEKHQEPLYKLPVKPAKQTERIS